MPVWLNILWVGRVFGLCNSIHVDSGCLPDPENPEFRHSDPENHEFR